MKIYVGGDNASANAVRGYLSKAFDVVERQGSADYTLLLETDHRSSIFMDSVDCPLEMHIKRHLRLRVPKVPIEIHTFGGVQSDRACHLILPEKDPEIRALAELAINQGFLDLLNRERPRVHLQGPRVNKSPGFFEGVWAALRRRVWVVLEGE